MSDSEVSGSGSAAGREIDVLALVRLVRRHWQAFLAAWGAIVVLMVVYLHVAPRQYTVTLEVAPVVQGTRAGGNLGALGSLVGLNLSGGGESQAFRMYLESIHSRSAAAELLKDQQFVGRLFPLEWSSTDRTWHQPSSLTAPVTHAIKALLGIPVTPWSPPSVERVFEYLDMNIKVIEDPKSPIVTIQMEDERPEVVAELLNRLDQIADQLVRQRALARANGYIEDITNRLKTVSVSEYRQALIDNLNDQEKARMAASARVRFAADRFSAPSVSSAPTSPRAGILLVIAVVVGAVVGVLAAFFAERYDFAFVLRRKPRLEVDALQDHDWVR